jgi:hypothetical protein
MEEQIKEPQKNKDVNFEKDQITAKLLNSAPHLHLEARGGTLSDENKSICAFVHAYEQGNNTKYHVDLQDTFMDTKQKCYLAYVNDLENVLRDVSNPKNPREREWQQQQQQQQQQQSNKKSAKALKEHMQDPHQNYPYACKGKRGRVGGGGKVFYGGDTWTPNKKLVRYLSELSNSCDLYKDIATYYLIPFWVSNEKYVDVLNLAEYMSRASTSSPSSLSEIDILGNTCLLPWHILNRKKSRLYPQFVKFSYGWNWDVREPKPLRTLFMSMWSPVELKGLKTEGYNGCIGRRGRYDYHRKRVFVGLNDGRELWVSVNNILPYNPLEMMSQSYDHPAKGPLGKYSKHEVARAGFAAATAAANKHMSLFGCYPSVTASPLLQDFFKQLTDITTELFMLSKDKYANLFLTMEQSTFLAFMAPFENGVYLIKQNLYLEMESRRLIPKDNSLGDGERSYDANVRDWVVAHFCSVMPDFGCYM